MKEAYSQHKKENKKLWERSQRCSKPLWAFRVLEDAIDFCSHLYIYIKNRNLSNV